MMTAGPHHVDEFDIATLMDGSTTWYISGFRAILDTLRPGGCIDIQSHEAVINAHASFRRRRRRRPPPLRIHRRTIRI